MDGRPEEHRSAVSRAIPKPWCGSSSLSPRTLTLVRHLTTALSIPDASALDGLRAPFHLFSPSTEVQITTSNVHRRFVVVILRGGLKAWTRQPRGMDQALDTTRGLGDALALQRGGKDGPGAGKAVPSPPPAHRGILAAERSGGRMVTGPLCF